MDTKAFFQQKPLNDWALYGLITGPMAVAMLLTMMATDLSTAEGVSAMIAYSVRWSIPWLYIAFAASSLQRLFSNDLTRWGLRNRKIFGLCFATGMAWQILFIVWLVGWHRAYYVAEVYVLRDVIEGLIGYVFLLAMTVTSFKAGRKRLSSSQWRTLHTWGIYFLWAYAFSVYWHALFYYREADTIDGLYFAAGLLAWALRLVAWFKQKVVKKSALEPSFADRRSLVLASGSLVLCIATIAMLTSGLWEGWAYENLYGFRFTHWLELYMPYWPFIPYLPLLVAAGGAGLMVYGRSGGTS